MKRALLISIHPEWAEKILNGKKTIEVRTWIPKDYVGWVYVVITKDNYTNHLYKKDDVWTLTEKNIYHYPYKNICGKVAFRFWFSGYYIIHWDCLIHHYYYYMRDLVKDYALEWLIKGTQLNIEQINNYGKCKTLYAWEINDLEIFDKPKELSEFGLTKAPQKCVWVYGGEQS